MPKKSCINSFYDTQEIMKISIVVCFLASQLSVFFMWLPPFAFSPGENSNMYEKEMKKVYREQLCVEVKIRSTRIL